MNDGRALFTASTSDGCTCLAAMQALSLTCGYFREGLKCETRARDPTVVTLSTSLPIHSEIFFALSRCLRAGHVAEPGFHCGGRQGPKDPSRMFCHLLKACSSLQDLFDLQW